MPLLRRPGQPYFLDPNSPNRIDCIGNYCYPLVPGDLMRQQFYQTPCNASVLEDPDFGEFTLGSELITNGTFTGSLASWTASPALSFLHTASGAEFQNASGHGSNLEQTGLVITGGSLYRFSMDVTGLSTGDFIEVYVGGLTPFAVISSNGTFTTNSLAGSDNTNITIVSESDNDFVIDNVSLKLITMTDWDLNGVWQTESGFACKEQTGTGDLEETVADYLTPAGYYKLVFSVTGYTGAGTLTPFLGPIAGTAVSSDGTFTQYISTTLTGVLKFTPSSDFIGCIYGLELYELRNDYTGNVVNQEGDSVASVEFEYFEDKVTLRVDFQTLDIDFGCYTVVIYDACLVSGSNLVANGDFAQGDTDWSRNVGGDQYDFSGGNCEFIFDPLSGNPNIITNGDFSGGAAGWTATGWTIGAGATHNAGNTDPLSRTFTISTPAVSPAVLITWIQLTVSGRTAGSFTITISDVTTSAYSLDGTFTTFLVPTVGGGPVTFSINPTSTFDGTIDDITVHESTDIWSRSFFLFNTPNPLITAANYSMEFEITNITATGPAGLAGGIIGMSQALVTETTVATHTVSIPSYAPGAQQPYFVVTFREVDPAGGVRAYVGSLTLDNVELIRVEPFEATYTTECINYQEEFEHTKVVTGYCDQDAFGFEFTNSGFKLEMRLLFKSMNPFMSKDKTLAKYGTGDAQVAYASSEKWWVMVTDLLDESAHDALSAIVDCDHFIIGFTGDSGTEYIAEVEDHVPQWRTEGDYSMAAIQLNVRLKEGGMVFNRHT